MNKLYRQLLILHAFVGIGAVFGSLGVLIDPSGKLMGISPEILKNGPFKDFLIPGIILFVVIGLGNIITSLFAHKKSKYQAYFSGVISGGLMIWIVVQCYVLYVISIIHIVYFLFGLYGVLLAALLGFKQKIFPLNKFFN